MTMVKAGNKSSRFSSVNHFAKIICYHHHHRHYHHHHHYYHHNQGTDSLTLFYYSIFDPKVTWSLVKKLNSSNQLNKQ